MEWYNFVIPVLTLIIGVILGFYLGIQTLKKQMSNFNMDDNQLREMAKKMGYNLNAKQLQQIKNMQKKMGR